MQLRSFCKHGGCTRSLSQRGEFATNDVRRAANVVSDNPRPNDLLRILHRVDHFRRRFLGSPLVMMPRNKTAMSGTRMKQNLNARLNEISLVDDDDYDVDMLELNWPLQRKPTRPTCRACFPLPVQSRLLFASHAIGTWFPCGCRTCKCKIALRPPVVQSRSAAPHR